MTGFIIRRLGQAIVVVIGVTLITFGLLHALPGSLARDILHGCIHGNLGRQFGQTPREFRRLYRSDQLTRFRPIARQPLGIATG